MNDINAIQVIRFFKEVGSLWLIVTGKKDQLNGPDVTREARGKESGTSSQLPQYNGKTSRVCIL